jgi:hypothetical protein
VTLVYSTRFVLWAQLGLSAAYVVPAGQRAVVKCVTAENIGAVAALVSVRVAGSYVAALSLPGPGGATLGGIMIVAYAGETIQSNHNQADVSSIVSGFLFDSPAGRDLQRAQEGKGAVGRIEPLPS